ncbi:MAG: DNA-binding response regulator [Clostridiales bacterium GWB2_37_7]|nr:MAG: DNA-binding response regulator [Clostridiales bacterium GWB2_37_7]
MTKPKILIADDEEYVRRLVVTALEMENMQVFQAKNGNEALGMVKQGWFDLIILDIMLGDINGYDVISKIRSMGINTPVFLLSGKSEDYDKIIGFGIGADSYITKPFSPSVLCAQVKTHIRRYKELLEAKDKNSKIVLGPFVFNQKTYNCCKNGILLHLSSKEVQLMKFFMENPNQVFTKEQLYQNVWGETVIDDNTVMVYIRHLRSKIEDTPNSPKYLQTVWGIGYKLSIDT